MLDLADFDGLDDDVDPESLLDEDEDESLDVELLEEVESDFFELESDDDEESEFDDVDPESLLEDDESEESLEPLLSFL